MHSEDNFKFVEMNFARMKIVQETLLNFYAKLGHGQIKDYLILL